MDGHARSQLSDNGGSRFPQIFFYLFQGFKTGVPSGCLGNTSIFEPPLATARAASCNGTGLSICSSVCLFVCLLPKYKNAIFSKTIQFRAMVSTGDLQEVVHGLFKEPIIRPIKSKMVELRHLENRHDVVFFCPGWSNLDKISQTGAE